MTLPYDCDRKYTLTAGELRKKLSGVSNDTKVFVVTDKSDDNYDENYRLISVHPVETVEREWAYDEAGDGDELNLLLHLPQGFYDTYECRLKDKQQ